MMTADSITFSKEFRSVRRRRDLAVLGIAVTAVLLVLVSGLALMDIFSANEYEAEEKYKIQEGKLALYPYHIYYDGSDLVLECTLVNGSKKTTLKKGAEYEISVYEGNKALVASAVFPLPDKIEPHRGRKFRFRFKTSVPDGNLRHAGVTIHKQ